MQHFKSSNTAALLQRYFRDKAKQLMAASSQTVVDHTYLRGSHRENVLKIYLEELLPKRFGIGKGMIYNIGSRSNEADIVIWDSQNYPQIQFLGHSLFFAESVKAVIEVKPTGETKIWKM